MSWLAPASDRAIGDATPPGRPLVELHDGRALASSVVLAERLGRPHHVVLDDIARFGASTYFVSQHMVSMPLGESVWLDREAIGTLLGAASIGWVGAGVDVLRSAYSEAFDEAEAEARCHVR